MLGVVRLLVSRVLKACHPARYVCHHIDAGFTLALGHFLQWGRCLGSHNNWNTQPFLCIPKPGPNVVGWGSRLEDAKGMYGRSCQGDYAIFGISPGFGRWLFGDDRHGGGGDTVSESPQKELFGEI